MVIDAVILSLRVASDAPRSRRLLLAIGEADATSSGPRGYDLDVLFHFFLNVHLSTNQSMNQLAS